MTSEKLVKDIAYERELAFYAMREAARSDAKYLAAIGQRGKTNAEAVLAIFQHYDSKIEKMIQKWERDNPL